MSFIQSVNAGSIFSGSPVYFLKGTDVKLGYLLREERNKVVNSENPEFLSGFFDDSFSVIHPKRRYFYIISHVENQDEINPVSAEVLLINSLEIFESYDDAHRSLYSDVGNRMIDESVRNLKQKEEFFNG